MNIQIVQIVWDKGHQPGLIMLKKGEARDLAVNEWVMQELRRADYQRKPGIAVLQPPVPPWRV